MDDEFMSTWTLTREGTTVTEVLREYHVRGFPKVRIPVEDLVKKFEKYGWSVDANMVVRPFSSPK